MRIAYLLQDFDMGGMPTWVYNLATRLRARHEIHFLCTHVPRISPKFRDVGRASFVGRNWLALTRHLQSLNIDVVQYGQSRVFGDCALAAGVPVVIERTDGIRHGAVAQPKRGLDAVVASSKGTVPTLETLTDPSKIFLIYNGVDTARMAAATPDRLGFADTDILIGRLSRFGWGKNIELLIKAVGRLKDRYPHVRLVLVGGNSRIPGAADYETELRACAAGLDRWVRFVGQVDYPESVTAGFDIGTCVSRAGNEGIPNSLMECMAAGKPVVATGVDDIGELVVDGKSGLLIDDDNVDQLERALERLVVDEELRRQLGSRARAWVHEHFNLDVQAAKYEALYEMLLERARRGSTIERMARAMYRRRFLVDLLARSTRDRVRRAAAF